MSCGPGRPAGLIQDVEEAAHPGEETGPGSQVEIAVLGTREVALILVGRVAGTGFVDGCRELAQSQPVRVANDAVLDGKLNRRKSIGFLEK